MSNEDLIKSLLNLGFQEEGYFRHSLAFIERIIDIFQGIKKTRIFNLYDPGLGYESAPVVTWIYIREKRRGTEYQVSQHILFGSPLFSRRKPVFTDSPEEVLEIAFTAGFKTVLPVGKDFYPFSPRAVEIEAAVHFDPVGWHLRNAMLMMRTGNQLAHPDIWVKKNAP